MNSLRGLGSLAVLVVCLAQFQIPVVAQDKNPGAVYVMTNKAEGNSVLVFSRATNGDIKFLNEVPTQGLGTGATRDPLMSQGSLRLSEDGKLLFAVNPASGELTAFVVKTNGLEFGSKVPSGGMFPVSVTQHGNVVYVLNQLGMANISGFTVNAAGKLQPMQGSTQELAGSGLALPADAQFTPDGKQILVTEKGTAQIDIFDVQPDGRATGPAVQPSSGKVPFGFAFGPGGSVIVSEAEGGLPHQGSASSYRLSGGGGLQPVSAAISDRGTAACWVAITQHNAWVVNTVTGNISAYNIGSNAELTLISPVAATTGTAVPIDLMASPDGSFLYVLQSAIGGVAVYRIDGNRLTLLAHKNGLPLTIQGIAVR